MILSLSRKDAIEGDPVFVSLALGYGLGDVNHLACPEEQACLLCCSHIKAEVTNDSSED